jgi:hypothetical protein
MHTCDYHDSGPFPHHPRGLFYHWQTGRRVQRRQDPPRRVCVQRTTREEGRIHGKNMNIVFFES